MLSLKTLPLGPLAANCYIVYDEKSRACLLIDPGAEAERVEAFLEEAHLEPKAIVNTHGHFDHIGAVEALKEKYHLDFYLHPGDKALVEKAAPAVFGIPEENVEVKEVEHFLEDGEKIDFAGSTFEVISTPGHTMGGCCFYFPAEKWLFTGDTVFRGTVGRTDLPGGDYEAIIHSVQKGLANIPNDVAVYPGHGPSSIMVFEREHNPYFRM